MDKIIGKATIYHGNMHSYMKGCKVRIISVLRRPNNNDKAGLEHAYLDDDHSIDQVGGVTAHDLIEVQPWIAEEGRYSWVTSDAVAADLEIFENLSKEKD